MKSAYVYCEEMSKTCQTNIIYSLCWRRVQFGTGKLCGSLSTSLFLRCILLIGAVTFRKKEFSVPISFRNTGLNQVKTIWLLTLLIMGCKFWISRAEGSVRNIPQTSFPIRLFSHTLSFLVLVFQGILVWETLFSVRIMELRDYFK